MKKTRDMTEYKEKIIALIQSGEIDMKPRWHFVLKSFLFFTGIIVVTLLTIYFLSFVLFFMYQSGVMFAPGFGMRGIGFFVMSSPWLLISVSMLFMALLYVLVRQCSFSYKRPLIFSMIGIVCLSLVCSWLVEQTPMHTRLGEVIERHKVPVFMPLYKDAVDKRPKGVVTGVVLEVTKDGFVLDSERDGKIEVILTESTRLRPHMKLVTGERLMVFGDRNQQELVAFGIRAAQKNFSKEPHQRTP